MDLYPRRKKKRRPHISSDASEDVKSQQSKKRKLDSPKLDPDPKRRRLSKAKRLDLHAFVSLPQTVMARVRDENLSATEEPLTFLSLSGLPLPPPHQATSSFEDMQAASNDFHEQAVEALLGRVPLPTGDSRVESRLCSPGNGVPLRDDLPGSALLYRVCSGLSLIFPPRAWDVMSPDSWDACTFVGNTALAAQGQSKNHRPHMRTLLTMLLCPQGF
ncbi:hypothetical protein FRC00_002323 [Tulasnella sp. 408]|nr:hypothetical protein FRC00_002323 [Tulasnella sp. 408]